MLQVGITGGIGSGKTTACKLFEKLGVPVYYADNRAKELMRDDKHLRKKIIEFFGKEAFGENGELNRQFIAQIVFSDEQKRTQLNDLVHPVVAADIQSWNETMARNNYPYSLREAALLVETGSYKFLDKLIVVTAPLEERVKRVLLRDGTTEEKVLERINAQLPEEEKVKLADYVIHNNDLFSLASQVRETHQKLLEIAQTKSTV